MLPLLLAAASAALLLLAFPGFNQPWAAWIALVPWLLTLRDGPVRAAFWRSYLVGLLFFLGSLFWLMHVTAIGWVLLCAYLALFFGAFGAVVRSTGQAARGRGLMVMPAMWVALEFARSHLLTGFGWNLLAYSQTSWTPLIQIADFGGAWVVSWVIVLVNVILFKLIDAPTGSRRPFAASAAAVVCVVAAYGAWRLHTLPKTTPIRVAVVQGNIPQDQKWDAEYEQLILERYEALTRDADAQRPDLIVWPETSVPGFLEMNRAITDRVLAVSAHTAAPILAGAPMGRFAAGRWRYTNSAALLQHSTVQQRYDKLHLVPYGEFIPFESLWPKIRELLPPIGDFTPGEDRTIFGIQQKMTNDALRMTNADSSFSTHHSTLRFSVLICFEDVFPELARKFAQGGAQMLVTITNDAWFHKTAAAYQHAQASTLRAVETRRPMIRAANTGWSGCIDAAGRWTASVRDAGGEELFVPGMVVCSVYPQTMRTLYVQRGDWVPWLCVAISLLIGFRVRRRGRRTLPGR